MGVEKICRLLHFLMGRDKTPDESEFSDDSSDPRKAVEVAVKGENLFNAVIPHDGKMNGVSQPSRHSH